MGLYRGLHLGCRVVGDMTWHPPLMFALCSLALVYFGGVVAREGVIREHDGLVVLGYIICVIGLLTMCFASYWVQRW